MDKKVYLKRISIVLVVLLLAFLLGFFFLLCFFSFELVGDSEVKISYKDLYIEQGVQASFLGFDLSDGVKVLGQVENGVIGEYKITYSYKFVFASFEKTRTVFVKDMDKPVIELKGESVRTICPRSEYKEEGYLAYDEVDGDLTDHVQVIQEDSSIKYKVSDSSSNSVEVERKIKKEDISRPTITLTGSSTVYVRQNSEYKELGYSATDNCDGNLTSKVKVTGSVNTSNLGTYIITYSVEDSSGNKVEVKRQVIVSNDDANFGVIYLTFDDGPSGSGSTARILDTLKSNGVHATFFVTGSGPDSLIKRMYEEGHAIALHTYTHEYQNIYKSVGNYFSDLEKIQARVKNITGIESKIIRFPGGSNNTMAARYSTTTGLMSILKEEVLVRGFSYFDWNVDASDAYNCAKSSVKNKKTCVYNNVVKNLSKKRSNIVLMHDIKSYTADVLPDIIRYAKSQGYTFDVLTMDTRPVRFR